MSNLAHPFTRIQSLIERLRRLEPNHEYLKFEFFVLGKSRWTDENWQEYQALFNPDKNLTMPEVDEVYCIALSAAIKKKEGKLNGSA